MSEFGEWEVNEHLQHFANYYSLGQRIWSTLHPKVTQEDVNQAITEVGPHIYGLLISAALLMQIRDRISGYLTRTISILRRLWDHVKYRNTHQAKEIYDKMLRDPSNFTSQDKDKLEALNASRDILGEQIDSTFKKLECLQEAICEIEELQSKATAKAALRHAYLTGICSELDALDAYYNIDIRHQTSDRNAQIIRQRCCWMQSHTTETKENQGLETEDLADIPAIGCLRKNRDGKHRVQDVRRPPSSTSTPKGGHTRSRSTESTSKARLGQGVFTTKVGSPKHKRASRVPGEPQPLPRYSLYHQQELQRLRATTRRYDPDLLPDDPKSTSGWSRDQPPTPPPRDVSSIIVASRGEGYRLIHSSSSSETVKSREEGEGQANQEDPVKRTTIQRSQDTEYHTASSCPGYPKAYLDEQASSEDDAEGNAKQGQYH